MVTENSIVSRPACTLFDANGNLQWERSLFAEGMQLTKEVAVDQDAVIVAGRKKGTCYDCDSVLVVKLDNTGAVIWKNAVFGGLNATLNNMRTIKQSNGNYAVATENAKGVFIFSPAGSFLDRKLAVGNITAICNTSDSNLAVLQTEVGNGFRAAVSKINPNGTQWYITPNSQQKMGPDSWMCCVDSWPIALLPLRNGGTLAMMRRVNRTTNNTPYYVISFLPLNTDGSLQ